MSLARPTTEPACRPSASVIVGNAAQSRVYIVGSAVADAVVFACVRHQSVCGGLSWVGV